MSLHFNYQKYLFIIFISQIILIYSDIIVKTPKLAEKFANGTIKVGLASFGNIPYGHTIVGNLYYQIDSTEEDKKACNPIDFPLIPRSPKVDESPFLLIERGNCTFVTKVRNVENAYAHAAIIINNDPNQDPTSLIMGDDGRGNEITIPSVIISYEDGQKLKQYYREIANHPEDNKKIVLEIDFEIEKSDNTVEYDLWYTPDQEEAYVLLKEFYKYHQEMEKYTRLNIHFVTYTSFDYKDNVLVDIPNCYSNGKYCLNPGKFNTNDGRNILHEALIQKCVHKYAYDTAKTPILFWNYMKNYYEECLLNNKIDSTCSNYCMKMSKFPVDVINKCVAESFETTNRETGYEIKSENKIFDQELELKKNYFVFGIPRLFINGRMFLGNLRADYVFEAICAGLKKKPDVCFIEGGFEVTTKKNTAKIIWIILLIVIINILIFCFCTKIIKKKIQERIDASDINRKIDTVVNSYLQMRDTK